jgi:two-component system, sensor histidine kinase and response regulator
LLTGNPMYETSVKISNFKRQYFFLLATAVLLPMLGWVGIQSVENEFKKSLITQLHVTLNSNIEILLIWAKEKKNDVLMFAEQTEVRAHILGLAALANQINATVKILKRSPHDKWLNEYLGVISKQNEYDGFVVLDVTGLQIGGLLDEFHGTRELAEGSDFFSQSILGDTVISAPFEIYMKNIDAPEGSNSRLLTMFVATPIFNAKGEVKAVLAFRIRPEAGFLKTFEVSQTGQTGKTYAFNKQGFMISKSRFNEQLKLARMITNWVGSNSILKVQVRDPGGNIMRGYQPEFSGDLKPLTLMAASAIKGENGFNIDGYKDYRGVTVVGAWTWLSESFFGVATEMDAKEAFAPLQTLKSWYFLMFGLLIFITIFLVSIRLKQIDFEKDRKKIIAELTEIKK